MSLLRRSLARYSLKKSPEDVIADGRDPTKSLKKTLGALDLTILGVGAIIGAGIFGATMAGPYIIFAFVLAGIICALAGLAYAELASTIPTSGSAYGYTYSSMGETAAWILGWALVLEYAVGSAAVAIGWSGNMTALLRSLFGVELPTWAAYSVSSGVEGGFVNLPAMLVTLAITAALVISSKGSARLTGVFVAIKIAALLFIIGVGLFFVSGENLALPPPPVQEGAWYAILGSVGPVVGAAAIIFFAYIGFDAVSTTAEETKNPKRDLPIGILGSLVICTILYILATTVLVGMVPYTDFIAGGSTTAAQAQDRLAQPFGHAFEAAGIDWAANFIRAGAIIGTGSVLMVLLLGGPRVFFALARDGLLPQSWSKVHPKYGTPYRTTIGTGVAVALFAGFGTLGAAGALTNIGTLFAFAMVCIGVIILRYTKPDLERPFRVPLSIGRFPILAAIGAVMCFALMASLARSTIIEFFGWMGIGLMIYALYGIRKSKLFGHVGRSGAHPSEAVGDVDEARV
jgi:basic amino acid/polyamine antiporter, APA family